MSMNDKVILVDGNVFIHEIVVAKNVITNKSSVWLHSALSLMLHERTRVPRPVEISCTYGDHALFR
jgi:hypothetical protein